LSDILNIDINPPIGYDLILNEIPEGARVLDLGCGDGELLHTLKRVRMIDGYGVELSTHGVSICLDKGLYCYQGDIDEGLADYQDNSFDYAILNRTIQDTKKPEYVLKEVMRICRNAIICFPNFGYFVNRLQLLHRGRMPKNTLLPYEWYESPNIHLLSIKDFQAYCRANGFPIKKEAHFSPRSDSSSRQVRIAPNIFAQYGFFILNGEKFSGRAKDHA
jgi:methionine biosynthesis protein MetW